MQTDTTCNFQQCWELLANNALRPFARGFHRSMLLCEKRANWHKLCRNQFNALKRVRALSKKRKSEWQRRKDDDGRKKLPKEHCRYKSFKKHVLLFQWASHRFTAPLLLTWVEHKRQFSHRSSLKTHHYSVKAKRGFYSTWCTASRVLGVKNQTIKQAYDDSICYAGTALTAGTGFFTSLKKPKWFSVQVFWAI